MHEPPTATSEVACAKPRRRVDRLLVERLPDETIVYDVQRHEVHCLNRLSTFVWERCDGETSTAALAERVRGELEAPVDEITVGLILEQLAASHLLDGGLSPRSSHTAVRRTRRDVARRLAELGFSGLVMTIVAPTAAEAASCLPDGAQCRHHRECCSNKCNGHRCREHH